MNFNIFKRKQDIFPSDPFQRQVFEQMFLFGGYEAMVEEQKAKEAEDKRILEELSKNVKPCPFCGCDVIEFKHTLNYGHGDCTFAGHCECQNCGATKGNVGNWGKPETKNIVEAFRLWNERLI